METFEFFFFLPDDSRIHNHLSIFEKKIRESKNIKKKLSYRLRRTRMRRICRCPDRWSTGPWDRSSTPGRGRSGNRRWTFRWCPRAVRFSQTWQRPLRCCKTANTYSRCRAAARHRRAPRKRPLPGARAVTQTQSTSDSAWLAMYTGIVGPCRKSGEALIISYRT